MTTPDAPSAYESPPAPKPPSSRRRVALTVGSAAALVALVVGLLFVVTRHDATTEQQQSPTTTATSVPSTTEPGSTTQPPTTTRSSTTTQSPTTSVPQVDDTAVLWPFPGTTTRYGSPVDAARSFATTFLRFDEPIVGAFQQGDARSGEVPIRANDRGPVTTILVRQIGPGDDWSVLGAVTANIDVATPTAGEMIASPVRVTGRALAYEGTVDVEVRQDGALGPIGAGFVTGGGDEKRAFVGSIPFETAGSPYGALVFFTTSAENGQVWEASTIRVALRSTDIDAAGCGSYRPTRPRPAAGEMEVKAYFNCDAADGDIAPRPVYRLAPSSPRVLQAALEVLLAGPTRAERDASFSSWFSADTAAMLRSVTITNGHAVIDFDNLAAVIPNASTSMGSALLASQLDATVFQFRTVTSVEYRLSGSCAAFNEWLQGEGCEPRTRPASED